MLRRFCPTLVRTTALLLLILAASPVTRPFATIDLFDTPASHEDAGGAAVKKALSDDGPILLPPAIQSAIFLLAAPKRLTVPDPVFVPPPRAVVLRL